MFRLNDSVPSENGQACWRSERWRMAGARSGGGWLALDRVSGKVQAINLPDFDSDHSSVTWFRDYAAYCGFQMMARRRMPSSFNSARRKPVLRKALAAGEMPACVAPV